MSNDGVLLAKLRHRHGRAVAAAAAPVVAVPQPDLLLGQIFRQNATVHCFAVIALDGDHFLAAFGEDGGAGAARHPVRGVDNL